MTVSGLPQRPSAREHSSSRFVPAHSGTLAAKKNRQRFLQRDCGRTLDFPKSRGGLDAAASACAFAFARRRHVWTPLHVACGTRGRTTKAGVNCKRLPKHCRRVPTGIAEGLDRNRRVASETSARGASFGCAQLGHGSSAFAVGMRRDIETPRGSTASDALRSCGRRPPVESSEKKNAFQQNLRRGADGQRRGARSKWKG